MQIEIEIDNVAGEKAYSADNVEHVCCADLIGPACATETLVEVVYNVKRVTIVRINSGLLIPLKLIRGVEKLPLAPIDARIVMVHLQKAL